MNFSAVILAGGKSSRMGRDKAFLAIGGQTLLARQIETVRAAGATEILISGRADADYSAFGCRVLKDNFRDAGPLAGIEAALAVTIHPLLLVVAVDLPAMNAMFLRGLPMAAAAGKGGVPRVNGCVEPLAALYPQTAAAIAATMLREGRLAARDFASACVAAELAEFNDFPDAFARLFRNLNSPAA